MGYGCGCGRKAKAALIQTTFIGNSPRPQEPEECSSLVKSFVAFDSSRNLERGFWAQLGLTSSPLQLYCYPSVSSVSVRWVRHNRSLAVYSLNLNSGTVEAIWPTLSYPLLTTPICLLIVFNLFAHYYFVCTVSPGFVEDSPREIGTGFFWSVKKQDRQAESLRSSGVRWSEKLNITLASTSKCRRCGQNRPEVCPRRSYEQPRP